MTKEALFGLLQSVVRLAAGATVIMLLLGVLHSQVPAIPAWGWWACLCATLIPLVIARLMYFDIQDAKKAGD